MAIYFIRTDGLLKRKNAKWKLLKILNTPTQWPRIEAKNTTRDKIADIID